MWKSSEEMIENFIRENEGRKVSTQEAVPMFINPQKIIGINNNYTYPDILNDEKMERLIESVDENGWINIHIQTFCLLMFPNGDLVVNGAGNHRAVLSKEYSINSVQAMVAKVIYED